MKAPLCFALPGYAVSNMPLYLLLLEHSRPCVIYMAYSNFFHIFAQISLHQAESQQETAYLKGYLEEGSWTKKIFESVAVKKPQRIAQNLDLSTPRSKGTRGVSSSWNQERKSCRTSSLEKNHSF